MIRFPEKTLCFLKNSYRGGRSQFWHSPYPLERGSNTTFTYACNLSICTVKYRVLSLNFLGRATVTTVLLLKKPLIQLMFVSLKRGCQKCSKFGVKEPSNMKEFIWFLQHVFINISKKLLNFLSNVQTCLDLKIVVESSSKRVNVI